MDESLQELEAELKALAPRRASSRWIDRINRELAAELPVTARPAHARATNRNAWQWPGWRSMAMAAGLALVVLLGLVALPRATAPAPLERVAVGVAPENAAVRPAETPGYVPVAAANVLYELKDEGRIKLADDTEARRLRYRYVDTYTWKNPRNNASLKWSVPRDEIRVLPASYIQN